MRGRLHGHWLRALGVFSAVAALVALWLLVSLNGDEDRDPVRPVDGLETVEYPASPPDGSEAADTGVAATSSAEPAPESSSVESPTPSSSGVPESSQAEPKAEPEPADPDCSATLRLVDQWTGGIEVSVTIVNSGDVPFSSWEVDLVLEGAEIYHIWDMRNVEGHRYANESWNGTLGPEGRTGAGFLAEVDEDFALPESVPCGASG